LLLSRSADGQQILLYKNNSDHNQLRLSRNYLLDRYPFRLIVEQFTSSS
jgi:hypothetical protein